MIARSHRPLIEASTRATIAGALLLSSAAAAQQTQVVRSTAPAVWGADLRLVEALRIGTLEGVEEYVFGRVGGVAVGREGRIYVADTQVPVIRMYDAAGKFLRNVGREGEGPGEYRSIAGIRTMPDGRVAIWDNRNRRIAVFTGDGEFVASHVVASGLFSADIFEVDRSGHFYVRTTIRNQPRDARGALRAPGRVVVDTDPDYGWIRVAPAGQVLDTLRIPSDSDRSESFVLATASGYDRPFTTELVTRMSPLGYLITGRNDTYAFEQHRAGAPALRVERSYSAIRLGREERAEWEAWARFFERRVANPSSSNPNIVLPPPRRVSYTIPETKPAFSDLRTDSRGRIWVRRYVEALRRPGPERPAGDERPRRVWREPPTFDVFEPDGRFLGAVTLPFDAFLHEAIDRQIWATVRGEFDETYVVRFRLEPARR